MDMNIYRRKGSPNWQLRLPGGGRISLKTSSRAKADRLAKRIEAQALEDRLTRLDVGPGRRLGEFTEEYLAMREKTVAVSTVREDRLALRELAAVFGNVRMERLDQRLEEFRTHVAVRFGNAWTRNKLIRHTKTALKYARRQGYCSPLLEDLRAYPVDHGKPIYLTAPEVTEFIAWARGDHGQVTGRRGKRKDLHRVNHKVMAVAVAVAFYTGMARAEIVRPVSVMPDCIQFRRRKTGRLMTVPISKGLRPHIAGMGQGLQRLVPWTNPRTYSWHFEMIRTAAGFPQMSPHKVRHTFATLLLAEGVKLETVSKLLGHADVSTTLKFYGHIADETKQRAVDSLMF